MRNIFMTLLLVSVISNVNAQVSKTTDSTRAKAEAKPEFEMKQYWFVMLIKGLNRNQDSVTADKIQEGHMANITRLAKAGKLTVAGPFGDDGNWRGIFILDCKDREEAEKLLQTDPAIASGRLAYEIHPWWTAKNDVFK
ncbi:MAG: YciI family protein [Ginsengibacter sp.]